MTSAASICVIMPTLALPERASMLRDAVASVRTQRGVRVKILLVVNGNRFDVGLVRSFENSADVQLVRLALADLPAALRAGREHVDSEWFAELDDDDLLLPDTLTTRLEAAQVSADCDAVVSNGIVVEGGQRRLHVVSWKDVKQDPLRALMQTNWLRPGAGLFRTAAVTAEMLHGMPHHLEWTYLALRLALVCRLRFLEQPGFIYHGDTVDSQSKSRDYLLDQPHAIDSLLALDLPGDVRRSFDRRRTAACNAASRAHLRDRALGEAWRWHLQTLRNRGGWRYLPGTRRLLWALMLRQRARTS